MAIVVAVVLLVVLLGAAVYVLRPAQPTLSPLDEALQGINSDGTYSKETALNVFAAAIGPLPGVPTPRPDKTYHSGTLALNMVVRYWSDLSEAQRQQIRDYLGPLGAAARSRVTFASTLVEAYQAIANADIADIEAMLGRKLGVPLTVVLGDQNDPGGAWAITSGIWTGPPGSGASSCTTMIPPDTANDRSRDPYMRWTLLHEMWHCFEYAMTGFDDFKKAPPWVTEGQASFVAEAITGGQGAPPPEFDHWRNYVEHPEKPLYGRAYDAVGFYPQLVHSNIDARLVLQPMLAAGGSDHALEVSGGAAASFTDRWGSSWFRDGVPNQDWEMTAGYGIPSMAYRAGPQGMQIADGDSDTLSAIANSGAVANVHTTAFVTEFKAVGAGRVADTDGSGDWVVRAGILDLCTSPSGNCTCPPGSSYTGDEPERASQNLHAAVTGEEHNTSVMSITGISKEDWCGVTRTPPPQKPCTTGCGGSNGDPHLRTIDGSRYDLQAAGEYVMLRSADGSLEIQGRQEPRGTSATINTAVAARVNGHRVAFYVQPEGVPEVRIDGAVVPSDAVSSAALGADATLSQYARGYELDFPDGTRLWALSVGGWGINLLVRPSDSLRSSGTGLLARVAPKSLFRVPAMPDGSVLPAPANHDQRYHALYEVLAPAWRVSDTSTLFDYESGKTSQSYDVTGFPPPAAPLTMTDLDPVTLATARQSCQTVTDADLADQCAFDVTVTGDNDFVTLYQVSDGLESGGSATLNQPPPTAVGSPPPTSLPPSTPPSTLGPLPADINLVADHLASVNSRVLGSNGVLYVNVATQGAGFGEVAYALLAVDPATGRVLKRTDAAAAGELAWAAGSLWAGEFHRPEIGKCQVDRLDPSTLGTVATVPTVCGEQLLTAMTALNDEIWFADPTGADADGLGAHLRRIDPSTNTVDSSDAGSVEMPVPVPFVNIVGAGEFWQSTSAGLITGDRQRGLFRLLNGSDSFEPLGVPGIGLGWYAAGDGVWTAIDTGGAGGEGSFAGFFNGGDQPTLSLGFDGYLAGADDQAIYVAYEVDPDAPEALVRYPSDGSAAEVVASAATVTSGSGVTLSYHNSIIDPLLPGDGLIVKTWSSPLASDVSGQQLFVQAIPVP